MLSHPKLNRDGFKPPTIWLTASSLGSYNGCERCAIIDAYFRHNGMYDNWHTKFGSALGEACASVARTWNGCNRLEVVRAAWQGMLSYPAHAETGFKSVSTLWQAILLFIAQWENEYKEGWRFAGSEKLAILYIDYDDDAIEPTGGAYDLLIVRDGVYKVLDFKAVGSNYFYNWEYDPQIAWYTLLDSLYAETPRMYAAPEYWTFVFKDDTPVLEMFVVKPTVFTQLIAGGAALLRTISAKLDEYKPIAPAADWAGLPASTFDASFWSRFSTNPSACVRGNFKCFNYAICHEGMPINWAPPREVYAAASNQVALRKPLAEVLLAAEALAEGMQSSFVATADADLTLPDFIDDDLFD